MTETKIQAEIMKYCRKRGHLVFRHSTEGRKDPKTNRWRTTSGTIGEADIQIFAKTAPSNVIWAEIKTPKGRQSAGQVLFQKIVENFGHEYVILRSVQDAKDFGL